MINATNHNNINRKMGPQTITVCFRFLRSFVGNTAGLICLDGLSQNKMSEWILSIDGIKAIGNSKNRMK